MKRGNEPGDEAKQRLLKLHTTTPVKKSDNRDYIKKKARLDPYSIAERILQLYILSKYPLDSAEMGVTGNQWNILVRTKILNHHPALQATSKPLEILLPAAVDT